MDSVLIVIYISILAFCGLKIGIQSSTLKLKFVSYEIFSMAVPIGAYKSGYRAIMRLLVSLKTSR